MWDTFSTAFLAQSHPINTFKVAREALRSLVQARSMQEHAEHCQKLVLKRVRQSRRTNSWLVSSLQSMTFGR